MTAAFYANDVCVLVQRHIPCHVYTTAKLPTTLDQLHPTMVKRQRGGPISWDTHFFENQKAVNLVYFCEVANALLCSLYTSFSPLSKYGACSYCLSRAIFSPAQLRFWQCLRKVYHFSTPYLKQAINTLPSVTFFPSLVIVQRILQNKVRCRLSNGDT